MNNKCKYTNQYLNDFFTSYGYSFINKFKTNMADIIDQYGYLYRVNIYTFNCRNNPNKFDTHNIYTIDNIKNYLKLTNKKFILISDEYSGCHKNLNFQCLDENCKHIFNANWNDIYTKNIGCPFCSGKRVSELNSLAIICPELIEEFHPTLNGELNPNNISYGSAKKVWWKCNNNPDHEWKASVGSRVRGNGCPYCRGLYASKEYNLLKLNPILCDEWDYTRNSKSPEEFTPNSGVKVWWICRDCGNNWRSRIVSRNNGIGCPKCKKSYGENRIAEFLQKNNFIFTDEYRIKECRNKQPLPFDFALFYDEDKTKLQCLIEYDGEYHYIQTRHKDGLERMKALQKRDQIKNEYVQKNNIKLIRIPYWEFNNIEQILKNKLYIA